MKKNRFYLGLLSLLFLMFSCTNQVDQTKGEKGEAVNLEKEKMAVSQLLDGLATATECGNFDMIQKIWLHADDVLLIGTESDEKLVGWPDISKTIQKQFGLFEKTLISITDQSIWVNDDATIAWFFEELNYNFVYENKAMTFTGIRFTGVLEKIDGEWRLVQQHMSIPAELEMEETQ